ncbi:MAG: hypothetical protein ACK50D_12060 [Burkholderiales bacterium]|jgi:hypothetical protein
MDEPTIKAINELHTDFSACMLALANALHAKGVLTKSELAAAAQERLLEIQLKHPLGKTVLLVTLQQLATDLERQPLD